MPYDLPQAERVRLRALARRQAELAALPVMQVRRRLWTETNDAKPGARPPFAIESWTFDRDFMPAALFECRTDYGRALETAFLRHIRHHEILNDDHVCPATLDLSWHVHLDEFGIRIPTVYEKDAEGQVLGYHFECPVKDLNDGCDMIKPSTFSVDRDGTRAEREFLANVFGDILPVRLRSGTFGNNNLTQRLMRIMSMETFFMGMMDCPDRVHGIMALLKDNAKRMAQWAEREGLLVLNNEHECTCGTCFNYTTLLPRRPVPPGQVTLKDMWSVMDSQETVGVSPAKFHEFCFPYYRELAELYGLVYWGCCEPCDPIWELSLSRLPNLKAISISKWARQAYMADALAGTGIVYSRKPDPNLLGVDVALNEAAWAAELNRTLDATAGKNVPVEFVVRDVYSMHGNLAKARRAVDIARRELDKRFGPAGNGG